MSNNPGAILEKPPLPGPPPYDPSNPGHPGGHIYQYGGDQPPPYYSTGVIPPPPGWSQAGPPPPPNYGSTYGATNVILAEPCVYPATQVIIVGGCPACRVI